MDTRLTFEPNLFERIYSILSFDVYSIAVRRYRVSDDILLGCYNLLKVTLNSYNFGYFVSCVQNPMTAFSILPSCPPPANPSPQPVTSGQLNTDVKVCFIYVARAFLTSVDTSSA